MKRALTAAIVGDHFMRPDFFQSALAALTDVDFDTRVLELEWPDVPMVHGYQADQLEGLKEFLGDPDEIADFIGDADVLINHLAPVTGAMLDRLPRLKLIAVSRGGPVNINVAAARERGVTVVNAPGRNATAVAEFTVGAILAETRLITRGHAALSRGRWRGDLYRADLTGRELSEMTVGLIGYGAVGSRVPALLKPFGCRIKACDPYVRIPEQDGVEQTDLAAVLSDSDVMSLHARVTDETRGFIAAPQFAQMPDGAYFINTARGPMVNYDDLYQALKSGKLGGAMLDTFAVEPPPADWPLLGLDNVTLTPHIAGASIRTIRYAAQVVAEEARRYALGEPLRNVIA